MKISRAAGYRIFRSLLLMALGTVLLIAPANWIVFTAASIFMGVICINLLVKSVKNPHEIELNEFFAMSILGAYALSSGITVMLSWLPGATPFEQIVLVHDYTHLTRALSAVGFTSGSLLLAGQISPFYIDIDRPSERNIRKAEFIVFVVLLISLYAFATGIIGFRGLMKKDNLGDGISAIGSLVSFLLAPIGATAVYIATTPKIKRIQGIVFSFIALFFLLLIFTQGRRLLIYAIIVYLVALRLNNWRSMRPIRDLFILAASLLLGATGYIFFFALRLAGYGLDQDATLYQHSVNAIEIMLNPQRAYLFTKLAENSQSRPFIINYLGEITDAVASHGIMMGDAILATLKMAVPSLVIGSKNFPVDEDLIHPHYGLPIIDQANTILTTGIVDFGWLGAIAYPLIIILMLRVLYWAVRNFGAPWLRIVFLFCSLYMLLQIEGSMTQYWVFSRDVLLLILLSVAMKIFISKNRRNSGYRIDRIK